MYQGLFSHGLSSGARHGALNCAPETRKMVLRDRAGKVLSTAPAAALKAPLDLRPKDGNRFADPAARRRLEGRKRERGDEW
jgi:hypothetical protein